MTTDHPVRLTWSPKSLTIAGLATGIRHRIVVTRPELWRMDVGALCCLPDQVLPKNIDFALAALLAGAAFASTTPQARASFVGHASADGDATTNRQLSLARCQLVAALALDRESLWEDAGRASFSAADLAAVLNFCAVHFGWSCAVDNESSLDPAIRAFQREAGAALAIPLDIDGDCGPQTRNAMFKVLRRELASRARACAIDLTAYQTIASLELEGASSQWTTKEVLDFDWVRNEEGRCVDVLFLHLDDLVDQKKLALEAIYHHQQVRRQKISYFSTSPCERCNPTTAVRILLQDRSGEPVANQDYVLHIGAHEVCGKTSSDGLFDERCPTANDVAILDVPALGLRFRLSLGTLPESNTVQGVQSRLRNLGFPIDSVDGVFNQRTRRALRLFQGHFHLPANGEMDQTTIKALVAEHGS